jgi:hypothetical protein
MGHQIGVCFDPETVELLRTVLDDAWSSISAHRKARTSKTELAERILVAAGRGERDPETLRAIALMRPTIESKSPLQPDQLSSII